MNSKQVFLYLPTLENIRVGIQQIAHLLCEWRESGGRRIILILLIFMLTLLGMQNGK